VATVRIIDNRHREYSAEVELGKGEPENPASWEEIYQKFYNNVTLLISADDAKRLGDTIMNLESFPLDALTKSL